MTLPYHISGQVIRGNRIGSRLGFPTANLLLSGDRIESGVYAARITVGPNRLNGVANAGTRPTVTDRTERFLEVYIFDFDEDIYGRDIAVELVAFLRPERKFDSVEALRRQIERDQAGARQVLSE